MSLANRLTTEGHPPTDLKTTASVRLEQIGEGSFGITRIELETVGQVPGVTPEQFAELAQQAKETCPVSRALAGTEITRPDDPRVGRIRNFRLVGQDKVAGAAKRFALTAAYGELVLEGGDASSCRALRTLQRGEERLALTG